MAIKDRFDDWGFTEESKDKPAVSVNDLEKHVRTIVDEHVGQKTEEARVAGESAAQVNAKIAAKAAADLEKKKAVAKAKTDKMYEKNKKSAGSKLELANRIAALFSNECHDEKGRFCEGDSDGNSSSNGAGSSSNSSGGNGAGLEGTVQKLLSDNPRKPGEAVFEYQSRICDKLPPEVKHEVLYSIREQTGAVDYIAKGADAYRSAHGLPNPQIDVSKVKAPLMGSEEVAKAFDLTPDESKDPVVQAAFEDFKKQNAEMYDFITKPVSAGGLGITVEVSTKKDPYASAQAQADDLKNNHHFFIESGLGGEHAATMTTEEYDHFRAVHDIFGHAGIGGGFDRHGEYQAWLEHMSMYTGAGRDAMSSEYRGVNSAMWASSMIGMKSPGTGKSVLLPKELVANPWDKKGNLIASAASNEVAADLVIKTLGLDSEFANKYDWTCPWTKPFEESK